MNNKTWLIALACAPLALTQVSCSDLECGDGTTESNGTCQIADGARPDNTEYCAPGTHYDDSMSGCVADLQPTVCGPNTVKNVREDGVVECIGVGGGGCSSAKACPQAANGKVTICGRLVDAETDADIVGAETGADCDADNPTASGPCSLELQVYDALTFAQNPTGTPPLSSDSLAVDDCGRFVVTNIPAPVTGFIAIGVDDAMGVADQTFLSGVAIGGAQGQTLKGLRVYRVSTSSDEKWSSSAGAGFSFGEKGAYLPIFSHKGSPVSGVVVTENGTPQPNEDYYFSDASDTQRTTIDAALNSTGQNGSGLLVDSALVNHSGQGSEDMLDGCVWPSTLADAIPGVYFVQTRESEDMTTGDVCE